MVVAAGAPSEEVDPAVVALADVGVALADVVRLALGEAPGVDGCTVLQVALAEVHLEGVAHREDAVQGAFGNRWGVASAVVGQRGEDDVLSVVVFRLVQGVGADVVFRLWCQFGKGAAERLTGDVGEEVVTGGHGVALGVPADAHLGDLRLAGDGHMAATFRRGGCDFGWGIGGDGDVNFGVDDNGIGILATHKCCYQQQGQKAEFSCFVHGIMCLVFYFILLQPPRRFLGEVFVSWLDSFVLIKVNLVPPNSPGIQRLIRAPFPMAILKSWFR